MKLTAAAVALITSMLAACQPAAPGDASSDASLGGHENVLIDLWAEGLATFGVYVPNENPPTPEQRRNREALSANVHETRSTQRIRVGRRQRNQGC